MFKILGTVCAALIVAFAISTSAQAQRHGGRGGHFGGARVGHFGGARVGHFGGARVGHYRGGARTGYYRGGARIVGRPYYRRGYRRYRNYGYRYGGYWPYWGLGVAAGALLSGWPYYYDNGYVYYEAPAYDSAIAYCIRRFKSYDPVSRTYLGYDGYRHPCP